MRFNTVLKRPKEITMLNTAVITRHYLLAALWTTTDEHGEPFDATYDIQDISAETLAEAIEDVTDFVDSNESLLVVSGLSDPQIGHDFWLTRNGHGAGFWDRGLGQVGEALSKASEPYGEVDLYAGDDGYIYC
jgi:hypothetical protein